MNKMMKFSLYKNLLRTQEFIPWFKETITGSVQL